MNKSNEIITEIANRFPTQKSIWDLYLSMSEKEEMAFTSILNAVCDIYNININDIVDYYELFVNDTLTESRYFFEHGCYRHSTYEEVDEYMKSKSDHYMHKYQIGLLLSLFLWPNHIEMRNNFANAFMGMSGKRYLEIGVGHGYYFSEAIANFSYESYFGIDINEDSLHMAKAIIGSRLECKNKQYKLALIDFLNMEPCETYDAIVSGEVLEHVEKPEKFLQKIAEVANENTLIFITTVINAPAVDHISLFKDPDELRRLFHESGLHIINMNTILYKSSKSIETHLEKKWPLTVSITAKKQSIGV